MTFVDEGNGGEPARVTEICTGREVSVSGRLDVNSVAEVRLAVFDILDRGAGDLLIHLAKAEIYDATGLGVIVGIHHRARRLGRRLVLVDVSPGLEHLLQASRLHLVLARWPDQGVVAAFPSANVAVPSGKLAVPGKAAGPLGTAAGPSGEADVPSGTTAVPSREAAVSAGRTVASFTE